MRYAPFVLVLVVGCKSPRGEAPAADAAAPVALAPPIAAVASAASAAPAPSVDASAPRADGELILEVRGGNCPPDKQTRPECRSYTYALRTDGTLRGGARRSVVPAEATDALFQQAADAFAAKHACIPNAPDRGSQALTLRRSGHADVARGGCGAPFEAVKARLEKLAAEP